VQPKARLIAFYLPQYHPVPENDVFWEKGFTEWTNVTKALPLFPGHRQPHLPADLGFYDLRVPETRQAQADLATAHGVEGFCYWHYWFGNGKRILERPFNEVLESGAPRLPFCLAWANETWAGLIHGVKDRVLITQTYPGEEDYRAHFQLVLKAFRDERYIKVDGKPLFVIYKPGLLPDAVEFTSLWRQMALDAGLAGMHFVGVADEKWNPAQFGFDGAVLAEPRPMIDRFPRSALDKVLRSTINRNTAWLFRHLFSRPDVYPYAEIIAASRPRKFPFTNYPCVLPNWDTTPRAGKYGIVFQGATPELFAQHLREHVESVQDRPGEQRIIFLKSWNEWAEGNYVEPDREFGMAYLEVIKRVLCN
jgi:hypothetical protein